MAYDEALAGRVTDILGERTPFGSAGPRDAKKAGVPEPSRVLDT